MTAEPSSETEDEPEPRREEGWWAWTRRWAVGDSDESDEESLPTPRADEQPPAASSSSLSRADASSEDAVAADAERAFLERVPLPPWLRYQVDRVVFGAKAGEEEGEDRGGTRPGDPTSVAGDGGEEGDEAPGPAVSPGAATTRGETLRGAVSVVSTSDTSRTPSLTDSDLDAFAESLDGANLVLDSSSAVARSSELAATAADAAIEKLAAALAAADARHRATAATASLAAASDGLEAAALSGGIGSEELRDALEVAKERAEEAREASAALARASREVARLENAAGADAEKGEEIAALAKERLRLASRASRAAIAAAGASIRNVTAARTTRRAEEETIAKSVTPEGAAAAPAETAADAGSSVDEAPETQDVLSSVNASVLDAAAAMELSGALSRIAEWSAKRTQSLFRGKSDRAKQPPAADEIGRLVQPSLQKVVAQSLEPASPEDLRAARVACGLAAWIYYLPKRQENLDKVGLRVIVSSLDPPKNNVVLAPTKPNKELKAASSERRGATEATDPSSTGGGEGGTALGDDSARSKAAARRAMAAADAAIEELRRAEGSKGSPEAMASAREAARLASSVATELQEALGDGAGSVDDARGARTPLERRRATDGSPDGGSSTESRGESRRGVPSAAVASSSGLPTSANGSAPPLPPVNYCVACDDATGDLWVVIEGSTSLASWQTNLTFQPVVFENAALDVRVHRGSYDAANLIYDAVECAVREHCDLFGANAKVRITGHSLGGSLAMVLSLMLVLRGGAPREAMAEVWAFGSPYVLCGGDALLARLGLPRGFIKGVAMGKDIVPRSFSCYYPQWARRALEIAPGSLKVNVAEQPSFLDEEMFYSPMGDVLLLQAIHGGAHPLLPPGPGLYQLAGEGMYEMLVDRVNEGEADEEDWLEGARAGARSGEWSHDYGSDSDTDSDGDEMESGARRGERYDDDGRTESDFDPWLRWEKWRAERREEERRSEKKSAKRGRTRRRSVPQPKRSSRLNRLACLTQSDAALTASLILGSVDHSAVLDDDAEAFAALLEERGRDAAQRVVLNTPHPLTVLSDPGAYGTRGSISRHHNPFNYLRALAKTRRTWESGSQPRENEFAEARSKPWK